MSQHPRQLHRYHEHEDRRRMILARSTSLLACASGAVYLAWAVRNLSDGLPVLTTAFVVAELVAYGLFVLATIAMWTQRHKPPHGLRATRPIDVDVFVTACGEPVEVLLRTLRAATRMRSISGGQVRVYALDDGRSRGAAKRQASRHLRLAATDIGYTYLSRKPEYRSELDGEDPSIETGPCPPDARLRLDEQGCAKAGNLNFGLDNSSGELVLTLDADQVPFPHALEVLGGYLELPRVAFIQARQLYDVPEGDPFNSMDGVFYGVVQRAFDARNAATSCGSGVLYRREALAEIDGFATRNFVEDLTTSYDIHARGTRWRSLYFPHPVSRGQAPGNIVASCKQRKQWAFDTMLMMLRDRPYLNPSLTPLVRLNYALMGLAYLTTGFVFPFFFLLPIISYATGHTPLAGNPVTFLAVRATSLGALALALTCMFAPESFARQFRTMVGSFHIYVLATFRAIAVTLRAGRSWKPAWLPLEGVVRLALEEVGILDRVYKPNNEAGTDGGPSRLRQVAEVSPQILLMVGNLLLPFVALRQHTAPPHIVATHGLMSVFAVWALWPVVFSGVMPPGPAVRADVDVAQTGASR